jgi:transcriptional regulator with XRE-family HTH domain
VKTTSERVQYIMSEMHISCQTEFGKLCGASRSTVNQWLSGNIKKIDPRYAFKLEDNSPFDARWIILGEGNRKK